MLTPRRIITDARLCLEPKMGFDFANVFFPDDVLSTLSMPPFSMPPMPLPNTSEIVQKVKEMKEKSGIRINFEISDQGAARDSS